MRGNNGNIKTNNNKPIVTLKTGSTYNGFTITYDKLFDESKLKITGMGGYLNAVRELVYVYLSRKYVAGEQVFLDVVTGMNALDYQRVWVAMADGKNVNPQTISRLFAELGKAFGRNFEISDVWVTEDIITESQAAQLYEFQQSGNRGYPDYLQLLNKFFKEKAMTGRDTNGQEYDAAPDGRWTLPDADAPFSISMGLGNNTDDGDDEYDNPYLGLAEVLNEKPKNRTFADARNAGNRILVNKNDYE